MDHGAQERYASEVPAGVDRAGVFIQAVGGGSEYTIRLFGVHHLSSSCSASNIGSPVPFSTTWSFPWLTQRSDDPEAVRRDQ